MVRGIDVSKRLIEFRSVHQGSIICGANKFGIADIMTPDNTGRSGVGFLGIDPSGAVIEDKLTTRFDNPTYYS